MAVKSCQVGRTRRLARPLPSLLRARFRRGAARSASCDLAASRPRGARRSNRALRRMPPRGRVVPPAPPLRDPSSRPQRRRALARRPSPARRPHTLKGEENMDSESIKLKLVGTKRLLMHSGRLSRSSRPGLEGAGASDLQEDAHGGGPRGDRARRMAWIGLAGRRTAVRSQRGLDGDVRRRRPLAQARARRARRPHRRAERDFAHQGPRDMDVLWETPRSGCGRGPDPGSRTCARARCSRTGASNSSSTICRP